MAEFKPMFPNMGPGKEFPPGHKAKIFDKDYFLAHMNPEAKKDLQESDLAELMREFWNFVVDENRYGKIDPAMKQKADELAANLHDLSKNNPEKCREELAKFFADIEKSA